MIPGDILLDVVSCEPLVDVDSQIDLQLELRRYKSLEFKLPKNCKETKKALIGAVREIFHIFSYKFANFFLRIEPISTVTRKSNTKISLNTESLTRIRAVHK